MFIVADLVSLSCTQISLSISDSDSNRHSVILIQYTSCHKLSKQLHIYIVIFLPVIPYCSMSRETLPAGFSTRFQFHQKV